MVVEREGIEEEKGRKGGRGGGERRVKEREEKVGGGNGGTRKVDKSIEGGREASKEGIRWRGLERKVRGKEGGVFARILDMPMKCATVIDDAMLC